VRNNCLQEVNGIALGLPTAVSRGCIRVKAFARLFLRNALGFTPMTPYKTAKSSHNIWYTTYIIQWLILQTSRNNSKNQGFVHPNSSKWPPPGSGLSGSLTVKPLREHQVSPEEALNTSAIVFICQLERETTWPCSYFSISTRLLPVSDRTIQPSQICNSFCATRRCGCVVEVARLCWPGAATTSGEGGGAVDTRKTRIS